MNKSKIIYIFVYRFIRAGGTENLILRLASQIQRNNNFGVRCACEKCSDGFISAFSDVEVKVDIVRWDALEEYCLTFKEYCSLNIVTFEWDSFIRFLYCNANKKKTLLYAVHPECIRGFDEERRKEKYHKDLRLSNKEASSLFIQNMISSGHIVVMDEVVKYETESFFCCSFDAEIIRICVDVVTEWDAVKETLEERFENRIIFSAARADFPFKGYLLGLIKWMKSVDDNELSLIIVSYGDGIGKLQEERLKLPEDIQKRVLIVDKLSYDEYRKMLSKSFLYVGMGTSIIDAAEMGIPAIPVKTHDYKLICNSRFDEDPLNVCAVEYRPDNDFSKMVSILCNCSFEDYGNISRKSFDDVRAYYSSEKVLDDLREQFEETTLDIESRDDNWKLEDERALFAEVKRVSAIVKENLSSRKLAIYGSGIGGRDLFDKLNKNGINVDCFVDRDYENIKAVYGVSVISPELLCSEKYYVLVSLKTYNNSIADTLKKYGYEYVTDYIYPYCDFLFKGGIEDDCNC